MKYSLFVLLYSLPRSINSFQTIREYTVNELASIRSKSNKTISLDTKYQESFKLFKSLIENANTSQDKDLQKEKSIYIFYIQMVLNSMVVLYLNQSFPF